jgi:aldose 1-epimerase
VQDTVFDLRTPTRIGGRLRRRDEQTAITRGIDHCYVLQGGPGVRPVATVIDPHSGRSLQVLTDQPGLQCYTGNFLDGTKPLRGGGTARQGDAFCLEPQQFPDAPNRPDAPGAILSPAEIYRHTSIFRFGVVDPADPGSLSTG